MTEEEKTLTAESIDPPEAEDFKDKYFRALAEGENMRKRLAKEKQEMVRFGIDHAVSDFLPAIDQLESALRMAESSSQEVKNWSFGFQMILSQFKEALHQHGITPFVSEGKEFDPNLHDAIEMVETEEVPEGIIIEECTKGYKSAQRTLRVARVKVAKSKNLSKEGEAQ
jgi:molecular chaperone GrpE